MVKISANRTVLNRIAVCRTFVQVDTQRLRGKLMRKLEELHDLAHNVARAWISLLAS